MTKVVPWRSDRLVNNWISSSETALRCSEGLLDRSGKVVSFYGTLDEYLTGEHDKPVKYVLDLTDPAHPVFEIHDLAIGANSKVVTIEYTKAE